MEQGARWRCALALQPVAGRQDFAHGTVILSAHPQLIFATAEPFYLQMLANHTVTRAVPSSGAWSWVIMASMHRFDVGHGARPMAMASELGMSFPRKKEHDLEESSRPPAV